MAIKCSKCGWSPHVERCIACEKDGGKKVRQAERRAIARWARRNASCGPVTIGFEENLEVNMTALLAYLKQRTKKELGKQPIERVEKG